MKIDISAGNRSNNPWLSTRTPRPFRHQNICLDVNKTVSEYVKYYHNSTITANWLPLKLWLMLKPSATNMTKYHHDKSENHQTITMHMKFIYGITMAKLTVTNATVNARRNTNKQSYMTKRKISDSVLWQTPIHPQKNPKSIVTTQQTPPKTSITQRLQTDLGRSNSSLVWLNGFYGRGIKTKQLLR